MEFFWLLKTRDGKEIMIPPAGVEVVKRRMKDGQPINTRTSSIPAAQIVSFDITDKPFTTQPLLEAAAHAFNEPEYNEDGSIVSRWVKKQVTHDRWNKYYSHHPYRKLADDGAMMVVAFKLPIHQVDPNVVDYCTTEEIVEINKRY